MTDVCPTFCLFGWMHVCMYARPLFRSVYRATTCTVPIPMFFARYVFSKAFYTFWVACTM